MSFNEAYNYVDEAENLRKKEDFLGAHNLFKKASNNFRDILISINKDQTIKNLKVIQGLELLIIQNNKKSIYCYYQYRLRKLEQSKRKEKEKKNNLNNNNNYSILGKTNTILDSLANRRGHNRDSLNNNTLIGEYSIINDNDYSLLSSNNGKNDVLNIQQGIMNLFETFAININFDDIIETELYKNKESNPRTLKKEELIMENQELRKKLNDQNQLLERLKPASKGRSKDGLKNIENLVLIDKKLFKRKLNAVIQTYHKQNNSWNTKIFGSNNINVINEDNVNNNNNNADVLTVTTGGSNTSLMSANSGNNNNSNNNHYSMISNQIISEKEAEIKRLQHLSNIQERQLLRVTHNLKNLEKERAVALENFNNLRNDFTKLEKDYNNIKNGNSMALKFSAISSPKEINTGTNNNINNKTNNGTNKKYGIFDDVEDIDDFGDGERRIAINHSNDNNIKKPGRRNSIIQSDDDDDDDDDDDISSESELDGIHSYTPGKTQDNIARLRSGFNYLLSKQSI